ncbi:MAG: prepilin-type N-terminal cleavage/methylation domain-containing protein [Candidatus Riflebacteria bacterium]
MKLDCSERPGVTLVEIMMAIVILALAVLPVIGTFSKFYGTASRQLEQETALKISEATMNKLMSHRYSELVTGSSFNLPLDFQTPAGILTGSLNFAGTTGNSGPVKIGNVTYSITAEVEKVFIAQNILTPHMNAMELKYPIDPTDPNAPPMPPSPGPPPLAAIATYSCSDDLIMIKLKVNYGGPKEVELMSFRADMSR